MVLTANTDARSRQAILDAGADEYLAKTGNSRELMAAIQRLHDGQAGRPAQPRPTHAPVSYTHLDVYKRQRPWGRRRGWRPCRW